MQAVYKGKSRAIHDGGGLCSPGRWPISQRVLPAQPAFVRVRTLVENAFGDWVSGCDKLEGGAPRVFWQLAAGCCSASPFHAASMTAARSQLDALLLGEGVDPRRRSSDRKMEINFRRLAAMLELAEDPDFSFLREFASVGAALGVDTEMPRVATVFERKSRWRWMGSSSPCSVKITDRRRRTWQTFVVKSTTSFSCGSVVAFSKEEALAKDGGRLAVAALGAVPKEAGSSAVRIIHDAARKVEVNHRIRVRAQVRFPRIDDLEGVLRQLRL